MTPLPQSSVEECKLENRLRRGPFRSQPEIECTLLPVPEDTRILSSDRVNGYLFGAECTGTPPNPTILVHVVTGGVAQESW